MRPELRFWLKGSRARLVLLFVILAFFTLPSSGLADDSSINSVLRTEEPRQNTKKITVWLGKDSNGNPTVLGSDSTDGARAPGQASYQLEISFKQAVSIRAEAKIQSPNSRVSGRVIRIWLKKNAMEQPEILDSDPPGKSGKLHNNRSQATHLLIIPISQTTELSKEIEIKSL